MSQILERIAAWESDGLIDADTALRLRIDEHDRGAETIDEPGMPEDTATSTLSQVFGPSVGIGEMFAYVGGGFIVGAIDALLARTVRFDSGDSMLLAVGLAVLSAALVAVGLFLRGGSVRQRRAAGVVFAVSVCHAAAAAIALTVEFSIEAPPAGLVAGLVATALAIALRIRHPVLVTQLTMLGAMTGLAAAALNVIEWTLVPDPYLGGDGLLDSQTDGSGPLILLVLAAVWWLLVGLALGVLALREAARATDALAHRRAALTRVWAGLVAVLGLATAVNRSDIRLDGDYGRVLEPWIGDLALLLLAILLVERAFRRGAHAFVFAAAIALIIALTDFNFSYLSESTELGLLFEGLILLAAGFITDKVRRRVRPGDGRDLGPPAAAPA